MNVINLMKDVLKAKEKSDLLGKKFDYHYGEYEKCYCILNTHAVYFIDKRWFYLDAEKLFGKKFDVKRFVNQANDNLITADDVGITKVSEKTKLKCLKTDKFDVWIDEKYLKYLDSKCLMFMVSSPKEPVFVYEDDRLAALVLPVVVKL